MLAIWHLSAAGDWKEAMFVFYTRVNLSTQHFLSGQGGGWGSSAGFPEVSELV